MAIAFVSGSKVVILDEPTAGCGPVCTKDRYGNYCSNTGQVNCSVVNLALKDFAFHIVRVT